MSSISTLLFPSLSPSATPFFESTILTEISYGLPARINILVPFIGNEIINIFVLSVFATPISFSEIDSGIKQAQIVFKKSLNRATSFHKWIVADRVRDLGEFLKIQFGNFFSEMERGSHF
jgi:hypothetical protein